MKRQTGDGPPILVVRRAGTGDLAAILEIARHTPELPQWSQSTYESLLCESTSSLARVMLVGTVLEEVAGFGVLSLLTVVSPPEGEVENLAMSPRWRRHGFGRAMLDALLAYAWAEGAGHVHLEVRAGNAAALALYASAGFEAVGRRPGYYRDPVEDAVLLRVHSVADLRHPV